ncbi:MAG: 2-hydroxychromene-2-carboxylate isomerase [Alphaproteobacteria bacterium MarineAlpha9_Bin4]|nr:hypothetical protein [Pelagibacterales bacterium]PPR27487.1 MAG: 2-hydroxychromene-2-carboxylate isomerase [Alphaproteobacteria bacterium MarineAlpha9_Bin4]|tara:strand:+ start:104 stop:718 length:615 start_codon:yes stop_codon:yes gene_type:complete
MNNNIKFYTVPASPWSFLSLDRIEKISNTYNLDLDFIPVDIFKLFEIQEIKMVSKRPLAIQKNRLNELRRWKDYLKVDFNIKPKFWPVNPNKSCKLIIAASIIYPNDKKNIFNLVKNLSEAIWVHELNIDDDEIIFNIAEKIFDIKKVKEFYFSEMASSILQENTISAAKLDIFGVPTFVYKNQIFWGQDRIFFLEKEIRKLNV